MESHCVTNVIYNTCTRTFFALIYVFMLSKICQQSYNTWFKSIIWNVFNICCHIMPHTWNDNATWSTKHNFCYACVSISVFEADRHYPCICYWTCQSEMLILLWEMMYLTKISHWNTILLMCNMLLCVRNVVVLSLCVCGKCHYFVHLDMQDFMHTVLHAIIYQIWSTTTWICAN